MTRRALALCLVSAGCLGAATGCADGYARLAEREAGPIQRQKQEEVAAFRKTGLLSPEGQAAPSASTSTSTSTSAGVPVPAVLGLADAIKIATASNRDYKSQREALYLQAQSLGLTRRDFGAPIFSGSLSYLFSGNTMRGDREHSGAASLGARQILPTGAQVQVSGQASAAAPLPGGADDAASLGGTVSIRQPLLRGLGAASFEPLNQGERDLLYAARDFEGFRQGFAIDVIAQYYGLVSQKQRVANTRRSTEALDFVARRAKAFFDVDRLNKIEKLRADQSYLRAKNGLIDEEQTYKLAADRFKIFLGLPTSVEFDIPENATPTFVPVTLDLDACVRAALQNRLDLATARDRVTDAERQSGVARNRLLPDISLVATYGIDSNPATSFDRLAYRDDGYSAGVTVELPLDRRSERNAYRASLIQVDRSRRALRQAEDGLVLEVRDGLRRIRQLDESIKIQREIIETERARVRYAELQYQAGEIGTRDLTEAQENLLAAENQLIQNVVQYEVQRLTLLRQVGVLFVSEEGAIHP